MSTGNPAPQLGIAIGKGLDAILLDAINFYDKNIVAYNSAVSVLSNIYALGILSDVLHNVHLIRPLKTAFYSQMPANC